MANNTKWSANDTQKLFMETLRKADGALTLAEVSEIVGKEIKSGSINTLIGRNLVQTEDVTYECNIVRKDNGKVVGSTKKTVKAYKLVAQPRRKGESPSTTLWVVMSNQEEGQQTENGGQSISIAQGITTQRL